MQLFIDTSQENFACALFDHQWKIVQAKIVLTKQKVEMMLNFFASFTNQQIKQWSKIYINLGPGSFTGCRIALLYVRTLAQIKQIPIYTTTTFALLKQQNPQLSEPLYIRATIQKSFCYQNQEINLVTKQANELELNYESLFANFANYLNSFELSSIASLEPLYAGQPQIGPLKEKH